MTYEKQYGFDPLFDKWLENWFAPVTHIPEGYWLALCMLKYQQQGLFE